MEIKQYSKYSRKYPAIDGIAKDKDYSIGHRDENAIRSDIEKILNFSDAEFNNWYSDRRFIAERLLKDYKVIASIPDLRYPNEDQQMGLDAYSGLGGMIEILKEGLDYLDIIKKVRADQKIS